MDTGPDEGRLNYPFERGLHNYQLYAGATQEEAKR